MAKARSKPDVADLQHDEVADSIAHMTEWIQDHGRRVLIIGIVAVVAVASIAFFSANQDRTARDKSDRLQAANLIYNQALLAQNDDARKSQIDSAIGSLDNLRDDYPGSDAARLALYIQGNCFFSLDELDSAQSAFEDYISEARTPEEEARGELALGYTHENSFYLTDEDESIDQAEVHFALAADLAPAESYLHYSALLNRARVLELRSQDQQALELYERIAGSRSLPRASSSSDTQDEGDGDAGFNLTSLILEQVRSRTEPQSFQFTAQLRADRLRATSRLLASPAPSEEAAPAEENSDQPAETTEPVESE